VSLSSSLLSLLLLVLVLVRRRVVTMTLASTIVYDERGNVLHKARTGQKLHDSPGRVLEVRSSRRDTNKDTVESRNVRGGETVYDKQGNVAHTVSDENNDMVYAGNTVYDERGNVVHKARTGQKMHDSRGNVVHTVRKGEAVYDRQGILFMMFVKARPCTTSKATLHVQHCDVQSHDLLLKSRMLRSGTRSLNYTDPLAISRYELQCNVVHPNQ
jgi:hypothetical protein